MKIGIITGKDDEISLHKEINKLVPKKYYENGAVHFLLFKQASINS